MNTRIRAIHNGKRVDTLLYVNPNSIGDTSLAGNLSFSKENWEAFRDLLTSGLPKDLADPLLAFLLDFIEENLNEATGDCTLCLMMDDEHEDTCAVPKAQLLLHRLSSFLRCRESYLVIEE